MNYDHPISEPPSRAYICSNCGDTIDIVSMNCDRVPLQDDGWLCERCETAMEEDYHGH